MPSDEIKRLCRENIAPSKVEDVIDFGSGTLYWSEWLAEEYRCTVYSVDVYYEEDRPAEGSFIFFNDIKKCLAQKESFSMVWMCDVLHHLDPALWDEIKEEIFEKTDIFVLKDIDAQKRVGNFANRMHDRLINHQVIHDVWPGVLRDDLVKHGFSIKEYALPKLWYPHFLIIAQR